MIKDKVENYSFILRPIGNPTKKAKIENIRVNGADEIWLKIANLKEEKKFNKEKYEIVLGGRVVEPLLSFCINRWNVMLPFITYKAHKQQCEEYLESIKYDGVYEKEDI